MHQDKNYPSEANKTLFRAILKLNNPGEAVRFFRDLLTIKEINDISKRFQIAKDLYLHKGSYETIAKKHKVSTTTVTRVALWLYHGMNGYKIILDRLFKSSKK